MEKTRFEAPVILSGGEMESSNPVSTASEAMQCLLKTWPGKRGPKHREAVQACHDALTGSKPTTSARRAFVAAAKEAGVLLSK
jgi:hypothetical protein